MHARPGAIAFLQVALDNALPPRGARASIPVHVVVADARGYAILGRYPVPIVVSDSDRSGATRLSATSIASASAAGRLRLRYSGAHLRTPAIITLKAQGPSRQVDARAAFNPGGSGIVVSPAPVLVSMHGQTVLSLGGPGTHPPFTVRTSGTHRSCARFVRVVPSVNGARTTAAINGTGVGSCLLAVADSAGHRALVPLLASMPQPITASPTAVTLCPRSGSSACTTDTAMVTILAPAFTGHVVEHDTCDRAVARVSAISSNAPKATFAIAGGSTTGTCRALFTGGADQQAGVAIIITGPGVGIDRRTR